MPHINNILLILSLVISLWAIVGIITKIIEVSRRPEKEQNDRLVRIEEDIKLMKESAEKRHEDYMRYFERDKARIDSLSEGNAIMQRGMLQLLTHYADGGNNHDAIKKVRDDLQVYLTNRSVI